MENLPSYSTYHIEVNAILTQLRKRLDSRLEQSFNGDSTALKEMAEMYSLIDLLDDFAKEFVKKRTDKSKQTFDQIREASFADSLEVIRKLYQVEYEYFVKVFPTPAKYFHRFLTITLPPLHLE
jgi:hypothetical protein